MRSARATGLIGALLLPLVFHGAALAANPIGHNLVGTWQCHNPVVVHDHEIVGEDIDYRIFVFDQHHGTFLGYYEVDVSGLKLEAAAIAKMNETDGMSTRDTDDGGVILRVNFTGVIGPEPDRFYIIDHLADAFKIGAIDSQEHLSYVVVGFGDKAAAHNGYCIRVSRERPDRP
ncbi:MAG: hypothetical protein GY798_30390 [Hyphomicrobiales bacterium]|nr:hypothetical protein [Hyphomicrobiales bacterium]